ncbi:MAG: DUF4062 domain-containing protein [Leptospiraceae bacterium]|nr:DUF4062 domain-containing protein [Leptospiraceae bacterium]
MKKVFVSSTSRDLHEYREIVIKAIDKLKPNFISIGMENFGARSLIAKEYDEQIVRDCQIFIILVGHLYGQIPESNEKSYTELEFDKAQEFNIPTLVFFLPDEISFPNNLREDDIKNSKQKEFREKVRNSHLINQSINSPQECAKEVIIGIFNEHMRVKNIELNHSQSVQTNVALPNEFTNIDGSITPFLDQKIERAKSNSDEIILQEEEIDGLIESFYKNDLIKDNKGGEHGKTA